MRLFGALRSRLTGDDLLFVFLIGHGTRRRRRRQVQPGRARSDASEWAQLLKPVPGRLVFVNTTGGSFPFLQRLAAPGASSSPRPIRRRSSSRRSSPSSSSRRSTIRLPTSTRTAACRSGRRSPTPARGVKQWFERNGQLADRASAARRHRRRRRPRGPEPRAGRRAGACDLPGAGVRGLPAGSELAETARRARAAARRAQAAEGVVSLIRRSTTPRSRRCCVELARLSRADRRAKLRDRRHPESDA